MKQLLDRIRAEGRNLGNGILKVDGFVNHQVDTKLMQACGYELAKRFTTCGASKVLTAEISGIAPAVMTALELGLEVVYARKQKPIQLNQSDLDVWMQIVHLSRQQLPGFNVSFSAHAMLTALGKSTGKSQHEWLKEAMARLGGAFVEMTFHGKDSFGEKGFLRYYRDDVSHRYVVELTESMLKLFEEGYTHIEYQQRQQLRKQPLALWLHGFLASHAAPYPMKITTIHRLSGSSATTLRDFKYRLRKALEALVHLGTLESFMFEDDAVKIKKKPTPSQHRHLINQSSV